MKADPFGYDKSSLRSLGAAAAGTLRRIGSRPTAWKTIDFAHPDDGGSRSTRLFKLTLAPESGVVPEFEPGQFVYLSFPRLGVLADPRPFTIASPPTEKRFIEIIAKDTGTWSGAAKNLGIKAQALVWGPFGNFSYLRSPGSGRFVFLAGGMGAAPFLSMIRYMSDEDRDARVLFIWGARTRDDMAEKEALLRAGERMDGFRFVPVLSHDPRWGGERGRIDKEKIERMVPAFFGFGGDEFEWNSASYRLCGPGNFAKDLAAVLRDKGVKNAAVHSESFGR